MLQFCYGNLVVREIKRSELSPTFLSMADTMTEIPLDSYWLISGGGHGFCGIWVDFDRVHIVGLAGNWLVSRNSIDALKFLVGYHERKKAVCKTKNPVLYLALKRLGFVLVDGILEINL